MTPEQLRLLRPLRPQTPAETIANAANLAWTVWPLSAVRAAVVGYCEAFSAAIHDAEKNAKPAATDALDDYIGQLRDAIGFEHVRREFV